MEKASDLVSSWIAHQKWSLGNLNKLALSDSPYFWAEELMSRMVEQEPEAAWLEVLKIFACTKDAEILACLAAGPLEDLLVKHGPQLIDRIEMAAKGDPLFGELLCGVWRNAIEDSVWRRLANICPSAT